VSSATAGRRRPFFLILLALVLLVYGGNLGDGPLADDELYLERAERGATPLLRSVTIDSSPQMIRPWPAMFWLLPAGRAQLPLLHLFSLLLHAGVAALIARLAARRAGNAAVGEAGLWLGALFASLPLLTEGVLWLSASFDLWAAFFTLLAFELALSGGERPERGFSRRELASLAAFLPALLSKESILAAPLVAPLLFGRQLRRRVVLAWGGLVAASLLARFALFGGLGGYANAAGEPAPLQPLLLLRNLFVQVPFRLLQPWREPAARPAGAEAWLVAAAMLLCLALAAWAFGFGRRREVWWRPPAALLVSALPLAAAFSLDPHHGGGRLLYFPAAVAAIALGAAAATDRRRLRWAWPLLAAFVLAAFANAQAYRRAAAGKEELLARLAAGEARWPGQVAVQVDAPDTVLGVPVWRNAVAAFGRVGLRRDLTFAVGHPGLLENPQGLGETLFVAGPDEHGRLVDWTGCERELLAAAELPPAATGQPAVAAVQVRSPARGEVLLYFWPSGGRPVPASARRFRPAQGSAKRLRLPPGWVPPLEFRVDGEGGRLEAEVELLAAPESCRLPHVVNSPPDRRR
jgi:hypothetical protein